MTNNARIVLLASALVLVSSIASANLAANVKIDKAPSSMSPGEKGDLTITVRNTGTTDWSENTYLEVDGTEDPNGNDTTQTAFYSRTKVGALGAGLANTYNGIDIEAPDGRGDWTVEAWIEVNNSRISSGDNTKIEVRAGYDGRFSGWDAPKDMLPGEDYTFELTVDNTGDVWWDAGEVVLDCKVRRTIDGDANEGGAAFERRSSISNEDIVYPGDDYEFSLDITSPPNNGEWELEWQMYDTEEGELFGQTGLSTHEVATTSGGYSVKVTVDKAPSSLDVGERGEVQVSVLNRGQDLPDETHVVIGAVKDPNGNTAGDTPFDARVQIGPLGAGQGDTLGGGKAIDIEAPLGRGEWELEAWVEVKNSRIRGDDEFEINVEADYDGKITGWRIEEEMDPDTNYTFQLTVTNTGDVWWDAEEVALECHVRRTVSGSKSEGEEAFERLWDLENDDLVLEGDRYTFSLKIRSPENPGEWELEWQMYDIEERVLFGQKGTSTHEVVPE